MREIPDAKWGSCGIKDEARVVTLLYNSAANKLLAQFEREVACAPVIRSVYIRGAEDTVYRRLTPQSEDVSYDFVVTSLEAPMAFLGAFRWHDGCGDWDHLAIVDLKTEQLQTVLASSDLETAPSYCHTWLSRLIAADSSGHVVVCVLAMQRARDSVVEYWLSGLDWQAKRIARISELRATFF